MMKGTTHNVQVAEVKFIQTINGLLPTMSKKEQAEFMLIVKESAEASLGQKKRPLR
jgi:hypothetical protein